QAAGVLSNDTDADGDPLTASLVSGTSHGTLNFQSDGSFVYTPNANFAGSDSFTYKPSDGTLTSQTVSVTLNVINVNDAPVASGDAYTMFRGGVLTVSSTSGVLSNDTDVDGQALTASLVSGPAHGSLTLNTNGSFTYTPVSSFVGDDTFT